jgi:hypothetical protein
MFVAAASTSIVLAAFYRVTQLPDYHQRHHVYCDDDGEALPTGDQEDHDRTVRILVALFTLATLLLSAWNWIVQGQDAGLAIITISWVFCQSSYLLTFLMKTADNNLCKCLLACSTVVTKATALRHRSADSCVVTSGLTRFGIYYFQGILRSIYILVSSCPWGLSCLHMLFFAAAPNSVS